MGIVDRVDRTQQAHPVLGVPIAVVYKYFDDQGNYLAATITYYAFIAIFPLLLLASSIFGFILQGRPDLEAQVLNSALGQFPIIGDQLGRPEGLQGSTAGVIVGTLAAIYGSLGVGQASQNAMNVAWSVPRNSRPNPFLLRLKSLLLVIFAGTAVVAISVVSALFATTETFGAAVDGTIRWLVVVATVLVNTVVLTWLFRLAAARHHHVGRAAPGALAVALMWQVLQWSGAYYATRVLSGTSTMNQTFGLVLGLIGIIYIAAVMAVLGMEINVVTGRRLWPRALLTPFTDKVVLTEADRRAYTWYAEAMRHKGFERVQVSFGDPTDGPTDGPTAGPTAGPDSSGPPTP